MVGMFKQNRTTNFTTNTLGAYLRAQPSSLSAFMNGSQRVHVGWRACRIVCIVAWQNGTRYRDGMKVTWCHSRLVWLVFEGSIPTCTCFHSENVVSTIAIGRVPLTATEMGRQPQRRPNLLDTWLRA